LVLGEGGHRHWPRRKLRRSLVDEPVEEPEFGVVP
jgi:hypothetical protein